ncbi:MAG TPA: hypothetical protein VHZ09_10300 [Acidobacteriaceae bacterium]|jgi:hypothetical protein|nr:hypothetical protein [Acidobacteriaceae bacterium]
MLLVTFHGGKPGKHPLKNNVHAYDKRGKLISPKVLEESEGLVLDELRGIHCNGRYLYVVVANKEQNSLHCYEGENTKYRLVGRFASHLTTKGILHPFDFTFDGNGYCYVSSQDTNVVTRLRLNDGGKSCRPAPIAPALPAHGSFHPGTFVASSVGSLSQPATTVVPEPAGLAYSADGARKHSVRGVLWNKQALYVADQPASRIKVFDSKGKFLGQSNPVETPTHLLVQGDRLYVTGANEILCADLPDPPGHLELKPIPGLRVRNGGAMAFSSSGNLYIASRTENRIFKFDPNFRQLSFECDLPDNPEFLLHI